MQIQPYNGKSGYRCWLSTKNEEQIIEYYEEEPIKQLAVKLMLLGLRSEEALRVAKKHVRKMDAEEDGWMLVVPEGKTGHRQTPLPREVKSDIYSLASAFQTHQDEPLIDVTTKTLRNWVGNAGEDLAESTGVEEWRHVRPHDLRRTWATHTYYSLSGSRAKQCVMSWGGWTDVQTFTENYLGQVPDSIAIQMMAEADLQ